MIEPKFYGKNGLGQNLYISKSPNNKKIRQIQTGAIYDEAIDVEGSEFTYEETDELIENEENEADIMLESSNNGLKRN